MSMMLYGAARLVDNQANSRSEVLKYWKQLEDIHCLHLLPQMPSQEYLEESIARLWNGEEWMRFSVVGIADGQSGTSDHLLLQAAQKGQEIKKHRAALSPQTLWTRVPQWRFLFFIFWHESLTEGFLVIEHTSGDPAKVEDQRKVYLTDALSDIWARYCWDMSCEDPSLYHFDLSLLPR